MNAVQAIKSKYDMDALLRVLAPKMEENVKARRKKESGKAIANAALAKCGVPLRVV